MERLFSIGVGQQERPLNYSDLNAWCSLAGFKFEIWECELLVNLAARYLSRLSQYSEDCAPPYMTEETRITRARNIAKLRKSALQRAAGK